MMESWCINGLFYILIKVKSPQYDLKSFFFFNKFIIFAKREEHS